MKRCQLCEEPQRFEHKTPADCISQLQEDKRLLAQPPSLAAADAISEALVDGIRGIANAEPGEVRATLGKIIFASVGFLLLHAVMGTKQ